MDEICVAFPVEFHISQYKLGWHVNRSIKEVLLKQVEISWLFPLIWPSSQVVQNGLLSDWIFCVSIPHGMLLPLLAQGRLGGCKAMRALECSAREKGAWVWKETAAKKLPANTKVKISWWGSLRKCVSGWFGFKGCVLRQSMWRYLIICTL